MANTEEVLSITELPLVVDVPDQPCQRLYEANPVLLGYDVVQYHFIPAYRDGGVAVRGKPEHAYNFEGYQFWFSTGENRELFIGDPWKYAPAWGGFCSYGIGFELPPRWPWASDFLGPPASPWEGWFIEDGVLGFNIWSDYTNRFLGLPDHMQKAQDRWTAYRSKLQSGPFNTHCIGHGPLKNWCLSQQPTPWLQELPTCKATSSSDEVAISGGEGVAADKLTCEGQVLAGNAVSDKCLEQVTILESGGVVSEHGEFHHFSNRSISPHAILLLKIFVPIGFLPFLVLVYWRCWKYRDTTKKIPDLEKASGDCIVSSQNNEATAGTVNEVYNNVEDANVEPKDTARSDSSEKKHHV